MTNDEFAKAFDNAKEYKPKENSALEADLVCLKDVEIKHIQWFWEDRIALGKLTVIAGQPGLGKSQITAMLSAHLTASKVFPDGAIADIGDVIILSAEDDVSDTIKPRLLAAGADMERCHFLEGLKTTTNGKTSFLMFDLEQHIEYLEKALQRNKNVRLIIIDPVSAYQGKTDSHSNAEIRSLLAPYSKLAAKCNVAVVLVTHFNKSTSQEPIERIIGSIGLIAAARAGYAVIKDVENNDLRYFLPLKNNIGNDKDGFSFHVEGVVLDNGIKTSRIHWNGIPVLAQKFFNPKKKTQTNGAKAFLQEVLSDRPRLVAEIFEEAEGMGYNKATIQRAATGLEVKRKKLGMEGGWVWFFSEHEDQVIQMMQSSSSSSPT